MANSNHQGDFKILQTHKYGGVKFLKATKLGLMIFDYEDVSFTDFVQGDIPNCGLISALAALSQRPEFSEEIAPKIEQTSEGVKFKFKMFYEGNQVTVTIDDALPFAVNNSLVYARSLQYDNLYLASLFEKAFVQQACNKSYDRAMYTRSQFAFSTFSNCMTCCCTWLREEKKQSIMDCIKLEVDNKSSVVLTITPSLKSEPDNIDGIGHSYVVMDYNQEQKAVKLYDPKFWDSNELLPPLLLMNEGRNIGELWVTMDKFEKRRIKLSSLHSKTMYKSRFQTKKKISLLAYDTSSFITLDTCKVVVEKTSTFMINFMSYSHVLCDLKIIVTTADDQRRNVKLNYELPQRLHDNTSPSRHNKGEVQCAYYQRFKLQPNAYVLSFEFKLLNNDLIKEEDIICLMKIGSVSKCKIEELNLETRKARRCTIL